MAEALPDGWTEHPDAASGNSFYYNAGTGETTWERPKPAAAAASPLPDGWTEHLDAASGRTFYFKEATGETSWEKPQSVEKKETGGAYALPESKKEDTTWSTAQARSLGKELKLDILKDKVQVMDKNTWKSVSKIIFALSTGSVTASTGMCVVFSQSQDEYWLLWRGDKHAEADAIMDLYFNPEAAQASSLPEGWTEHEDPGSGKTFYFKAATGETSWEKPQTASSAADALPDGWTEHNDPNSGKTFYYKAATGETSWEKPRAASDVKAALPEGWAEHVDPPSGRTFYYKAATGETSWERPRAEDSGALALKGVRTDVVIESSESRAAARSGSLKKSAW